MCRERDKCNSMHFFKIKSTMKVCRDISRDFNEDMSNFVDVINGQLNNQPESLFLWINTKPLTYKVIIQKKI